jgi:outer membrane immunogenic protein
MKLTALLALSAAAAAALVATGASGADLLLNSPDPIYSSPLFNFEGFYVGGSLGAGNFSATDGVGTVGVVAGANFAVSDSIITGVEFQGDAIWDDTGFVGADALFLGKLGGYITDSTLIYADAGAGWVVDDPSYAIGAGIEQAVTDQLSVRGEGMFTGSFGNSPGGGKVQASLLWHVD